MRPGVRGGERAEGISLDRPMTAGKRSRLDVVLVERGIFESRSRAAAAVIAGSVRVAGETGLKPGQLVSPDIEIELADDARRYVSRGGIKLENALEQFGFDVSGRSALDAGASTGGFTDCLLQRGALRVAAVDVAYGEFAWSLRQDARVEVIERTNVRHLTRSDLPWPVDLAVCDLSFISLTKVLPALVGCLEEAFDMLALVKPQFEVGREAVGKGGVVRDADARRSALVSVAMSAVSEGAGVIGFASSGLPGPKGNLETFVHLVGGRGASDRAEIERLARIVEP